MTGSRRSWWQWPWYLLRRAVVMEWRGYQSLWRLAARRPRVPDGAAAFAYHQPVLPALATIIVVSAIEVVVVDLAVARWPAVRLALLVLGLWGLLLMFGMVAGMLTRPHSVGPAGIRARSGSEIDLGLPWEAIESVEVRRRTRQGKEPALVTGEDGTRTYHLRIADQTNLLIRLERRTAIRLPHGTETVDAIALYVENPQVMLEKVRELVGTPVA